MQSLVVQVKLFLTVMNAKEVDVRRSGHELTPASLSNTSRTMMGGLTANSATSPHSSTFSYFMVISHVGLLVHQTT